MSNKIRFIFIIASIGFLIIFLIFGFYIHIVYNGFGAKHYISNDTAELVIDNVPEGYFDSAESEENAYLLIIFTEGLFGYYLSNDHADNYNWEYKPELEVYNNKLNSSELEEIGNDLDLKIIEHSKNNTLIVSCNEDRLTCEINRESYWENVVVVPSPWPVP